jgi:hypothetical protein
MFLDGTDAEEFWKIDNAIGGIHEDEKQTHSGDSWREVAANWLGTA